MPKCGTPQHCSDREYSTKYGRSRALTQACICLPATSETSTPRELSHNLESPADDLSDSASIPPFQARGSWIRTRDFTQMGWTTSPIRTGNSRYNSPPRESSPCPLRGFVFRKMAHTCLTVGRNATSSLGHLSLSSSKRLAYCSNRASELTTSPPNLSEKNSCHRFLISRGVAAREPSFNLTARGGLGLWGTRSRTNLAKAAESLLAAARAACLAIES